MTEDAKSNNPHAAAAQSLRDTAKWLVGGVTAIAASALAGSSLTNLGALDPQADFLRLALAAAGILTAFLALGAILHLSVQVLTRESITLRQLAENEGGDNELARIAKEIAERYSQNFPIGIASLSAYVKQIDDYRAIDPQTDVSQAFLKYAARFDSIAMPDACFLVIRQRFDAMIRMLPLAVGAAAIGFGLFAWAANPPASAPPVSKGFSINFTL